MDKVDISDIRIEPNKYMTGYQERLLDLRVFFRVFFNSQGPLIYQVHKFGEGLSSLINVFFWETKKVYNYSHESNQKFYDNENKYDNFLNPLWRLFLFFTTSPIWFTGLCIKALTYLNADIRKRHDIAKREFARKNLIIGSEKNPVENMIKAEKKIVEFIGKNRKLKLNALIIYLKKSSETIGDILNNRLKPRRIITIGGEIKGKIDGENTSFGTIGYRKKLALKRASFFASGYSNYKSSKFSLESGKKTEDDPNCPKIVPKVIKVKTHEKALNYNLPNRELFSDGFFPKKARQVFHIPHKYN
jgi:hypothetical protein